jgi:hypothetical protein
MTAAAETCLSSSSATIGRCTFNNSPSALVGQ